MGFRSWLRTLLCSPKSEKSAPKREERPLIRVIREDYVHPIRTPDRFRTEKRTPERFVTEKSYKKMSNSPPPPYDSHESILSNEEMSIATVTEVSHRLGSLLAHIPHSVCGLAAMTYYGFNRRQPKHVTILCPLSSRRVLKYWALAQGMYIFPDLPHVYGIKTTDGAIRRVNVRFVRDFEDEKVIKFGRAPSCFLSLAGIADDIAVSYVKELAQSAGQMQNSYARDIIWLLQRIKNREDNDHSLTRQRAPNIYKDTFWVPFTLSYPSSLIMFVKAGMDVDEQGWLVAERCESSMDETAESSTQAGSILLASLPTCTTPSTMQGDIDSDCPVVYTPLE